MGGLGREILTRAMSQENVELVKQAYLDVNAFMRGDLPGTALAHLLDPEIEWDWNIGLLRPEGTPQRVRGADELIAFLEQVRAAWSHVSVEPLEFSEGTNGRMLVHADQKRRIPDEGAVDSVEVFHLWTIRRGRVSRLEIFLDAVTARRAAGVRD
jgi:ketosteroid isomerase-like protein